MDGAVARQPIQLPGPALMLPAGITRDEIEAALVTVSIDLAPAEEIATYARIDCERFIRTLQLVPPGVNRLLEVGSNPYFTTLLVRWFRPEIEIVCTNFVGGAPALHHQRISVTRPDGRREDASMAYWNVNVETDPIPAAAGAFDCVLFCEVLEHMTNDPVAAITNLSNALVPDGALIVTTPNVARLENVARMAAGVNIYDPYSGYGPYGRHNREYNRHELHRLMGFCGFEDETSYTADVSAADLSHYDVAAILADQIRRRPNDLGQYLFTRWRKAQAPPTHKPDWLYRSYPAGVLAPQP